jgi:cupin fold WbuC family metalloprotein
MIIIETKNGRYYRPHKHLLKAETCHIIKGVLDIFLFNDCGTVSKCVTLAENQSLIMRIGAGVWHTALPSTPFCIYHESKLGPFDSTSDVIFPKWAPDGTNFKEGLRYLETIKTMGEK